MAHSVSFRSWNSSTSSLSRHSLQTRRSLSSTSTSRSDSSLFIDLEIKYYYQYFMWPHLNLRRPQGWKNYRTCNAWWDILGAVVYDVLWCATGKLAVCLAEIFSSSSSCSLPCKIQNNWFFLARKILLSHHSLS